MRTLRTGSGAMLARAGVSAVLALAAVGVGSTAGFAATTTTQSVMTLSSTTGPQGGGNTVTLTLPSTAAAKFTNTLVGVQFQSTTASAAATASCSTNPATTGQATATGTVRFISNLKVSVVVPDLTTLAATSNYFLLCAYNQAQATGTIPTSATVVGKANYIASVPPTLRSTGAGPIVPATGPSTGGQLVTIYSSASDFPASITAATPLTATLGGLPMTNITPLGQGAFSAVTPARPASATQVLLTVTTAGGTVTSSAVYTYVNGISISPNTVATGQSVDVDVMGTNFNTLTFDGTAAGVSSGNGTAAGTNSATAHVYLVAGAYDQTGYAAGVNKTVGQSTECVSPVVISDSELICTVNAAKKVDSTTSVGTYTYATSNLANGTYTVTVVNSGSATAPTFKTVVSSGATFTVADF